jgi:hypothetical protein
MTEPRRFDVHELIGADDDGGDAGLGEAVAAARALEAAVSGPDARPSTDLADQIMAAIAREPAPRPIGIVAALRRRPGLGGLVDSLRVAWSRALASGRPITSRAGGLAYVTAVVLLAVSLTGVAAYTTAGAIGLLGPHASQTPLESPSLPTPGPLVSPEPTEVESTEPSESPEASDAVEPSDDQGGASQEPGDDHGGDGGSGASGAPGSTDDHGDDGGSSGSESQTPKPSQTARPSGTPKASSSDG